jgi:hypothetical protein
VENFLFAPNALYPTGLESSLPRGLSPDENVSLQSAKATGF